MTDYYVEWRIEVDADSPREAAKLARRIQRDPREHGASVFHVFEADNGEPTVGDLEEELEGGSGL